jgi:hypothetical protein
MLSVANKNVLLSVIMLNAVKLSVVMLSVVVLAHNTWNYCCKKFKSTCLTSNF